MNRIFRTLLTGFAAIAGVNTAVAQETEEERQQNADSSFDAVMQQNEYRAPAEALGGFGGAVNAAPVTAVPEIPAGTENLWLHSTVEVPLERYEGVRSRIHVAEIAALRSYDTLVVLGSSAYEGRAVEGGLSLKLHVQATLRGAGLWKTVPLVGEEVAVISARIGSTPVPLTNQNGYQVWVTDQAGEVGLDLELLVPARGPKGSLEYDFLVPRTPVTQFDCSFPGEDLEPKLHRAVRADVTSGGGNTQLSAWLEPTSRIRVVGFKDLGEDASQPAKVYAEGLHLLSLDENSADLFTVVRYNILQSGTREFDVQVPPGWTVVSADGEGAFRYTLGEAGPEGTLLHGETAFAIRNNYEISLRLSRALDGGKAFDVVPPHAVGVEREYGWLAVEVIGNLKLEEQKREQLLALDVSQLPEEMVRSAVSPVLMGYRFHSSGAHVELTATRLPEREPAAGSVDQVTATTVIASEGKALTDLQITLRNRLRHSLRLRLPEGMVLRSSLLDGEAIKPSIAEDGAVLLPLKRSAGTDQLQAFTLQLVLESDVSNFGWLGWTGLSLPEIELPVSSLAWNVSVPAANVYTRLWGDVEPQSWYGAASWYTAPRTEPMTGHNGDFGGEVTGESGALPVRIRLPEGGTTLRHDQYWIGANHPVEIQFGYLRGWLRAPLQLLWMLGLTVGLWSVSGRWGGLSARKRLGNAAILLLATVVLGWFSGVAAVLFALVVGGWASLTRYGGPGDAWAALVAWWGASLEAPPSPGSWRAASLPVRLAMAMASLGIGFWLFLGVLRAIYLLGTPLAG